MISQKVSGTLHKIPQAMQFIMILTGSLVFYLTTRHSSNEAMYYSALIYLFLVMAYCWANPALRGRHIGYPMQAVSLIWFIVYGLGSGRWAMEGDLGAIEIVYAGAIGTIFLAIGYYYGTSYFTKNLKPSSRPFTIDYQSLNTRLLIMIALSAAATLLFIAVGGIPAMHADALTYRFVVREKVSSYVVFLLRASQLPLYFYWAIYLISKQKKTFESNLKTAFLIFFVLFVNWIPGWRNPLMLVMMNILFIYIFCGKKVNSLAIGSFSLAGVASIMIVGFLRLTELAAVKRVASVDYITSHSSSKLGMFVLWATSQFANYSLGFLTALKIFPDRVNYLFGGVLGTTLYTMLPGHQELLDEKLKRWSGMDFDGAGLNLTLLGESYADFGWVGILLYPFLYGLILSYMIVKVEQYPTPSRIVITAFIASAICLGSVTGLLSLSSFWIIGVMLFWIATGERWKMVASRPQVD